MGHTWVNCNIYMILFSPCEKRLNLDKIKYQISVHMNNMFFFFLEDLTSSETAVVVPVELDC